MHFHSTIAVAAGAALLSVAAAKPVCRPKSPGQYGSSGHQAAPVPQGPNGQGGWNNWQGAPVVIRTTTMPYNNQMNPQATNGPKWGGWNGGANPAPAPAPTYAAPPPVWGSWYPGQTETMTLTLSPVAPTTTGSTTGSLTDNPVPASTTITSVSSTTSASSGVVSPTAISTTDITTTTATTLVTSSVTTSTTTTTATSTNPACPAGTFVLMATNAENAALNNLYAGLANNGVGNLVAFSEATADTAVQVAFDANCQLVSAVGPLLVIDDAGAFSAIHYQYMNDPTTIPATYDVRTDICSVDATNVLSCAVGGQTILQTVDDVLSIGDQLYYQAVTVMLVPVV